tara:strand:+ start:271 stop:462 length:192 start_codon:yes stop_codon:yes gene_type:complete
MEQYLDLEYQITRPRRRSAIIPYTPTTDEINEIENNNINNKIKIKQNNDNLPSFSFTRFFCCF